jgi:hypothetical protein
MTGLVLAFEDAARAYEALTGASPFHRPPNRGATCDWGADWGAVALTRMVNRCASRFTREGSLLRPQPRPLSKALETAPFLRSARADMPEDLRA